MSFRGQVGVKVLAKGVGAKEEPGRDNGFGTKGVRASQFRVECGRQNLSDSLISGAPVRKETIKITKNSNGKTVVNKNETP